MVSELNFVVKQHRFIWRELASAVRLPVISEEAGSYYRWCLANCNKNPISQLESLFFLFSSFTFSSLKTKTNKQTSWQGDQRSESWPSLLALCRASKLFPSLRCHPLLVAFVLMAASWLPLLWLQRDNGKSSYQKSKNVLGMGQNSESLLQERLESKNIFFFFWA